MPRIRTRISRHQRLNEMPDPIGLKQPLTNLEARQTSREFSPTSGSRRCFRWINPDIGGSDASLPQIKIGSGLAPITGRRLSPDRGSPHNHTEQPTRTQACETWSRPEGPAWSTRIGAAASDAVQTTHPQPQPQPQPHPTPTPKKRDPAVHRDANGRIVRRPRSSERVTALEFHHPFCVVSDG
jgi:hypothetical protein